MKTYSRALSTVLAILALSTLNSLPRRNAVKAGQLAMNWFLAFLLFAASGACLSTALAQGTAFTYQGQLITSGAPANGSYDMQFTLFAANAGGVAIAGPVTNIAVGVSNGLFTTIVNFGPGVFTGGSNWLQIAVSTNAANAFTNLAPRQQLTPAPYAIFANTASNLSGTVSSGQITGTIPLADLPAAVVTNNETGVNFASLTTSNLSVSAANQIAPLTIPPRIPAAIVGSVSTGSGSYPISIAEAGRYAYIVNYGASSMQVIDVSTPTSPAVVGSVSTGSGPYSVAVAGRYAYVVNNTANTLQVIDVSTPSSPSVVGSVGTYGGPESVAVAGHYAYVANYTTARLQVIDVGTPSSPVVVGSVVTADPQSVAVAGRYAYVANSLDQMQVVDVGNPTNPVVVGSVTTGTSGGAQSITVSGRYAYVATYSANGIEIVDVSNPAHPTVVGSIGTANTPQSIAVAGRYAYVTGDGGMEIVDVSNPTSPLDVGLVGSGDQSESVAVAGRYAYMPYYTGFSLLVIDLGGGYVQQLEAGTAELGSLQTRDSVAVGNNLDVRGGLTVNASARISGGLDVDTITATNFTGNGGGLTSLNPSQLTGGTIPSSVLPGFQGPNYDTVGGGQNNTSTGTFETIGGGELNVVNGGDATVSGGEANKATNSFATVGGGVFNVADGIGAVVGGGGFDAIMAAGNHASGNGSTIGGGVSNAASAFEATVPGGYQNVASGKYSFAAGQQAQATNQGAFVWADSQNAPFTSTSNDSFNVRAQGGARFVTGGAGMVLDGQPVFTGNNGAGLTNLNAAQVTGTFSSLSVSGSQSGGFGSDVALIQNTSTSGSAGPALRVIGNGNSPNGVLSVSSQGTGLIAQFGNAYAFVADITTNGTFEGPVRIGSSGTTIASLEAGQAIMPASSLQETNFTITFPTAFNTSPKIIFSLANDPGVQGVSDVFAASVSSNSPAAFSINVYRLNGVGWGQSLRINWQAWQ